MKALNLKAHNTFEFTDQPIPDLGSTDVLIQVKATGICGSDVHGMDGSSGRRIPPIVMGHESAGLICRIGESVTNWKIGDRVTFDSTISCGHCEYCQRGDVNLCNDRRVLGVSCNEYSQAGAFAEYIKIPERILYRLPDGLSFEHAAFCEPVAVAIHAVSLTDVKDKSVLVVGVGIIGLLIVQALRMAGAKTIFATDLDNRKLALAEEFGAQQTFVSNSDTLQRLKSCTDEQGVDVVIEVVGLSQTIDLAIHALKKSGTMVAVGNISAVVDIPLQKIVTRELKIVGSCAIKNEYPSAIDSIASGQIQVAPLLSKIAPLSEGDLWFSKLYNREDNLLKVILKPELEDNG